MAQLNIRIDDAARAALDVYAEARGMVTGDLVRRLIDDTVKNRATGEIAEAFINPYNDTRPRTLTVSERRTLALQHRILALLSTRPAGPAEDSEAPDAGEDEVRRRFLGHEMVDKWGTAWNSSELAGGEVDSHLRAAEALEEGYTAEYPNLFTAIEPELSRRACDLLHELLTMFRLLQHAWSELDSGERAGLELVEPRAQAVLAFHGFDQQDPTETRLLGYARYLLKTDSYRDLREHFDDQHDGGHSHAPWLPAYLQLLEVWRPLWQAKRNQMMHSLGAGPDAWRVTAEDLRTLLVGMQRLERAPRSGQADESDTHRSW